MTDTQIPDSDRAMAELEALLAPIALLPLERQLAFWRRFREVHRTRTARGEVPLAPELLRTVDDLIARIQTALLEGTHG